MNKLVKESLYEFINPKTDKYKLEDTLHLGPKALKIKEIEEWFATWAPDVKYTVDDELNIRVLNNLDLRGSAVTEMPDNLHVGRSLFLRDSAVTKLPDNLHVGRSLYLEGSAVTELPDDLYVGGETYKDF